MDLFIIFKLIGFLLLFLFISFFASYFIVEVWIKEAQEKDFWRKIADEDRKKRF